MLTQNIFLCYLTCQKCYRNSLTNFKPNQINFPSEFVVFTSCTQIAFNNKNVYSFATSGNYIFVGIYDLFIPSGVYDILRKKIEVLVNEKLNV